MKRVVQIFKKDMAHLLPQILTFVALLVIFAWEDPTYSNRNSNGLMTLTTMLTAFLPLACWLLVTSAVQEESAIGNEQYWLTRPFTLSDLLVEKALFLFTFISIPVFICQAIVLAMHGLPPAANLGHLIARQVFLAAWLLLPMLAMGAVTKDLRHAFLGGLIFLIFWLVIAMSVMRRMEPSWVNWVNLSVAAAIAAVGSGVAIFIQYIRRRMVLARTILGATVVLAMLTPLLLPADWGSAAQAWYWKQKADARTPRISFDPSRKLPSRVDALDHGEEYLIPFRIDNIPRGLGSNVVLSEIGIVRGAVLSIMWPTFPGQPSLKVMDLAHKLDGIKNTTIHLRGSIGLALPDPTESPYRVCLTKDPYAPYSTSPWFGPLSWCSPEEGLWLHVAHVQVPFDFGPLRLSDYLVTK